MGIYNYTKLSMRPNWQWFRAMYLFNLNQPEELCLLIQNENMPTYFRHPICEIITGKRVPNKNSAVKLKTTPQKRLSLFEKLYDYEEGLRWWRKQLTYKQSELNNNNSSQLQEDCYKIQRIIQENYINIQEYGGNRSDDALIQNYLYSQCYKAETTPSCIKKPYETFKLQLNNWIFNRS